MEESDLELFQEFLRFKASRNREPKGAGDGKLDGT